MSELYQSQNKWLLYVLERSFTFVADIDEEILHYLISLWQLKYVRETNFTNDTQLTDYCSDSSIQFLVRAITSE